MAPLHDWLTPGVLIGIVGLVLTLATLRFAHRIDKRRRSADAPTVVVEIERARAFGDWLDLNITLRNRTESPWEIDRVLVKPAKHVLAVPERHVMERTRGGGFQRSMDLARSRAVQGVTNPELRVEARGAPRGIGSRGDEAHTVVLLLVDASVSSVSIRVILRSLEASARSITIDSRRTVPATTSSATL